MAESAIVQRFKAALPAGEYSEPTVLSEPEGAMAVHFQAVLAEATWHRMGGRPCFLKALQVAAPNASENTEAVVGQKRLARMRARLERARKLGVPMVEVFHADFIGDGDFFMLCMERVTPLDKVNISREQRISLAEQMLTRMVPPIEGGWHHFDLCLKNLGLSSTGDVVFIDLDSLYLVEGEQVFVSTPFWKPWRLPDALLQTVEEQLADGLQMDRMTAIKKQRFDLVLAAAELTLNHEIPGSHQSADDWLPAWLNDAPDQELARVWRAPLLSALGDPDTLDLDALVRRLHGEDGAESRTSKLVEVDQNEPEVHLKELDELGHLMRNDRLNRMELTAYLARLRSHLADNPEDIGRWREIRLLCVGYLRDLETAKTEVAAALRLFPQDAGFKRWGAVLDAWSRDVRGA